ncbi:transmembrane protein 26-like [Erpetoichthys calabaricus]|uniref:transmembrane protein 26-like n=1 Tax=Erpetoichthys calabaricus TaxID=27687 RepID=UPI002234E4B0|nr:transmembrane protein 26-like [Erpetoichthys calabaricus]
MVWRVVWVKGDKVYWALAIGVCLLVIESFFTLRYTSRGEWKWFSPSVFLYLCSALPCVWILELNTVEFVPNASLGSAHRREHRGLSIPKVFDTTIWTTGLEQSMLFILVLGRWLMPAGELSEDQLSQLLMMDIGMGADILELFEPFKEPDIKIKYRVLIFGLSVFSWAFLQFPIVLTQTTSVATNQYDVVATEEGKEPGKTRKGFLQTCFSSEMWSNIVTVGMLDGPFFIYRVYALAWGKMENQMTIFFACKNVLSVVFVIYMVSKDCCKTGDTDT